MIGLDTYSLVVITGIFFYMCCCGHMLWKEAHEVQPIDDQKDII